ncbi:hypothetical protein [Empedobacter brevis]|uniref:hypothetical protein n=1 Tax=Empedobacter brevis TaxID=247 RepID=UPI00289AD113|nr:hypothetical protein [Empedobacter brevis]
MNISENQREKNNSPQITQISAEKICKQKHQREFATSAGEKEAPQITQINAEKICKKKINDISGRKITARRRNPETNLFCTFDPSIKQDHGR